MKKKSLSRVFGHLLWREVFRNWTQSLAIVAIGAIAVTLFVGLSANSASLSRRVETMIAASSPADIYVTTDPRSLGAKDDSDRIESLLDEGDYLESRFYAYCKVGSRDSTLAVSPFFPTLSKAYDLTLLGNESHTDYFYIDQTVANDLKDSSGGASPLGTNLSLSFDVSSINLPASSLELIDSLLNHGKTNPFREGKLVFNATVTGIMKHPENTTKASPIPMLSMMSNYRFQRAIVSSLKDYFTPTGAALIYRYGFYERLGWGDGQMDGAYASFPRGNQYLIHLRDKSTIKDKQAKIRGYYQSKETNNLYLLQSLDDTAFMSGLRTEADQAEKLTLVFPVVFFIVAVLVILTTLRQNILKRRTDIGTFKALGLTRREIHAHFLTQTAALVGFASLIGAAIGPFLIPFIMTRKYQILYTLPARTYVFPYAQGFISIALFLVVALLATLLITYKEISLKPVESLRPKAMKVRKATSRKKEKPESRYALSMKMAGRNIVYDPLKSIMVVLGVLGCTALLVCGFGIDDTIDYDVKTDPFINSNFTVMAHYAEAKDEAKMKLDFGEIKDKEGKAVVDSYQAYDRFSLDLLSGEKQYTSYLTILGSPLSYSGAKVPDHMVGEFPLNEVAISSKCALRLSVGVGDKVSFYVNNKRIEAKINRVYDAFYGNGVVIHGASPLFETPYTSFANAWLNAKEGVSQTEFKALLLSAIPSLPLVDTSEDWQSRIISTVSSIKTMTMAIKVFALSLAAVVVYNLGLLNFRERMREIATLKVLGFHTLEIGLSLLVEALSMSLIGVAGGLVIGIPFMKLVLIINEVELVHYLYMIYPITYIFSALFTLSVALIVNLFLTYRVKHVKSVEALKSVE